MPQVLDLAIFAIISVDTVGHCHSASKNVPGQVLKGMELGNHFEAARGIVGDMLHPIASPVEEVGVRETFLLGELMHHGQALHARSPVAAQLPIHLSKRFTKSTAKCTSTLACPALACSLRLALPLINLRFICLKFSLLVLRQSF
jgi:hypothetical protein